ncbi:MAG: pyruvate formate lyase family protein [Planctomycetes bacterium]|nr:pyruvate formate lyase family protein [Planctomycetota bacterium]
MSKRVDTDDPVDADPVPAATGSMTGLVQLLREKTLAAAENPRLCALRAESYTDAFRQNQAEPPALRHAIAFREALTRTRIHFDPDDLLVSDHRSAADAITLFPENDAAELSRWLGGNDSNQDHAEFIARDDAELLEEILPWWLDNAAPDKPLTRAEPILTQLFQPSGSGMEDLLRSGLKAYRDNLVDDKDSAAVKLCLHGLSDFIERYEKLARVKAKLTASPERNQNLTAITGICSHIKHGAPHTFHQALQLLWFCHAALLYESNRRPLPFGRLDQLLLPYYQNDIAAGVLTEDRAVELLQCLLIKMAGTAWPWPQDDSPLPKIASPEQIITVGGIGPDGNNAVNPLSYLIVRAYAGVAINLPLIAIRMTESDPRQFAVEYKRAAMSDSSAPVLLLDGEIVPKLIAAGMAEDGARNYAALDSSGRVAGW